MAPSSYQVCSRCVMDTSDPKITFDQYGVCNHCREYVSSDQVNFRPKRNIGIESLFKSLKASPSKAYDCVIGVSGGLDSTYLAYLAFKHNLRVLLVHIDAGWNTEAAVNNISKLVDFTNYKLVTHVVRWSDIQSIQRAYFRSQVPNQDTPQDHIFASFIYKVAARYGIKTILSGGNFSTEGIFPSSWHEVSSLDSKNLFAIYNKYGDTKLTAAGYDSMSFFSYYLWYPIFKQIKVIRPLDYCNYQISSALKSLIDDISYTPYKRKHGESFFTKLYQNYFLPTKFGYDKRKPHLSSLIMSGQITRNRALQVLSEELYESSELSLDIDFFCKRIGISIDEFTSLMNAHPNSTLKFANWNKRYSFYKNLYKLLLR